MSEVVQCLPIIGGRPVWIPVDRIDRYMLDSKNGLRCLVGQNAFFVVNDQDFDKMSVEDAEKAADTFLAWLTGHWAGRATVRTVGDSEPEGDG